MDFDERTDFLTKLLNRRGFIERLDIELDRSRRGGHPVTFTYLDCDNFKDVNDRGGHRQGDVVLSGVVQVLRARLRQVGIAGRLGGDEFSVMPDTASEQARVALPLFGADLEGATRDVGWPVTFSIGAISFVAAPKSPESALHADVLSQTRRAE